MKVIVPEIGHVGRMRDSQSNLFSATSLAALAVAFSGYSGSTYIQSGRRKAWFKAASWLSLPRWKQ